MKRDNCWQFFLSPILLLSVFSKYRSNLLSVDKQSKFFNPVKLTSFLSLFFFIIITTLPSGAFAGSFTAFGPQSFVRASGTPVVETGSFSVNNPNTTYTLQIQNGSLEDSVNELVSSSIISINGLQVVGPDEFSQNITYIEKEVTLSASNTFSVELRGKPGGTISISIAGEDNDPPLITATLGAEPNIAGWHNQGVTVTYTCTDAISGVSSCPSPITVSGEGANQAISATATDNAGNTATASVSLNIDKTAPTIIESALPAANASGWNNTDVDVSFSCTDTLSGVDACTGPLTTSTEGTDQSVSGTATDLAGNTASASLNLNIDKTAPSITESALPAANASGWNNTDVTVSFSCADALSGVDSCIDPVTLITEGSLLKRSRAPCKRPCG